MHSNRYWLLLLAIFALATCWKGGQSLIHLYQYYRLTSHTHAEIVQTAVQKQSEDKFLIQVTYRYQVGDKTFDQEELWHETFRNPWSAEQKMVQLSGKKMETWYAGHNAAISSLQKKFPLKECLSAGLLTGLLIYLIWLGFYVGSYRSQI